MHVLHAGGGRRAAASGESAEQRRDRAAGVGVRGAGDDEDPADGRRADAARGPGRAVRLDGAAAGDRVCRHDDERRRPAAAVGAGRDATRGAVRRRHAERERLARHDVSRGVRDADAAARGDARPRPRRDRRRRGARRHVGQGQLRRRPRLERGGSRRPRPVLRRQAARQPPLHRVDALLCERVALSKARPGRRDRRHPRARRPPTPPRAPRRRPQRHHALVHPRRPPGQTWRHLLHDQPLLLGLQSTQDHHRRRPQDLPLRQRRPLPARPPPCRPRRRRRRRRRPPRARPQALRPRRQTRRPARSRPTRPREQTHDSHRRLTAALLFTPPPQPQEAAHAFLPLMDMRLVCHWRQAPHLARDPTQCAGRLTPARVSRITDREPHHRRCRLPAAAPAAVLGRHLATPPVTARLGPRRGLFGPRERGSPAFPHLHFPCFRAAHLFAGPSGRVSGRGSRA
mmetsp:Transcript_5147/g.15608  ORF Transcript_5147/g.15608 Transcript_5147/m.15608 type:complete len:457 (-) Transcript_5147:58-1428(-)